MIQQLREEVAEYGSFQSHFNPQIETLRRELNSLKIHLNKENNSNNNNNEYWAQ